MEQKTFVNLDSKTIYINGEITTNEISYITFNLLYLIEEDNIQEEITKNYEREPIKIYISSPGGELQSMWGLIDIMLTSKTPIYTYCIGYAHSAAFKIFLAGKKRFAYQHSSLVYHQLSAGTTGKFLDMIDDIEEFNKNQYDIEEYVKNRTKITQEQLEQYRTLKKDWYFSLDEAKELNVVTDIIS